MKSICLSETLKLPLEIVTETSAVLGIRGSGKSHTATVQAEEAIEAGIQCVIIDPTDVWWGLRSSRSGKQEGLSVVVFGGEHGQVPLNETDGAVIADFLIEDRISAVLSVRHLRKAAQRRFVTDLAEQLYHRKGEVKHRTSMLVICDECDAFIPQRVTGDIARSVGAWEDIVRRGRASGIGVILISQRPATVHKDVLTQLETLIVHQVTSPQDRNAVKAWMVEHDTTGQGDKLLGSLASLNPGRGWIWSPRHRIFECVQVRQRKTFDSSKTPELGRGKVAEPKKLASVDLDALRNRLSATIEQAEANDPKKLRNRIVELERQLAKPVAVDDSLVRELSERVDSRDNAIRQVNNHLERIRKDAGTFIQSIDRCLGDIPDASAAPSKAVPRPVQRREPMPSPSSNGAITGGKHRMLVALAQHNRLGPMDAKKLGILAGMRHTSGSFSNYLSSLRVSGLIEGDKHSLRITQEGISHAGDFDPLPTGDELIAWWREKLGGGGIRRMIEALANAGPDGLGKGELASAAEMSATSGSFSNYISKLRTAGVAEGRDPIRLADVFF